MVLEMFIENTTLIARVRHNYVKYTSVMTSLDVRI